jgi:hypothetical protein
MLAIRHDDWRALRGLGRGGRPGQTEFQPQLMAADFETQRPVPLFLRGVGELLGHLLLAPLGELALRARFLFLAGRGILRCSHGARPYSTSWTVSSRGQL